MSQTAYFRIGVFVVAALVIGCVGIVVFGSGAMKENGIILETYLDESIQGLAVGSPVKYRGVQVGKVESIDFVYLNYAEGSGNDVYDKFGKWVIVQMSISPKVFSDKYDKPHDPAEVVQKQVDQGMRVRLASQGITGVVYLEIDYLDPVRNPVFKPEWVPQNLYVPSAPSTATRLTDSAETVVNSLADARLDVLAKDVDKLVNELTRAVQEDVVPALDRINGALADLGPTFKNVAAASEDLGPLMKNARQITEDLAPAARDLRDATVKLPDTVDKVNKVASRADETLAQVAAEVNELSGKLSRLIDSLQAAMDRDLDPTLVAIHQTSKELPQALASLKATLRRVDHLVAGEQDDVNSVVSNLRTVTRDIDELSGYAKKYPAHILFGNPPPPRERR
ncbi:MAG: MCE family protein [Planctomycetes bacterium]|nr:MCE family protein [Planctomycetota bacterium]